MSEKIRSQFGYLVAKIHQLSKAKLLKLLESKEIKDLNPAEGRVLFALWKKDNIPIVELSNETKLDKSSLTPLIDKLEKKAYLKRVRSTRDRRVIHIVLSDKAYKYKVLFDEISEEMIEFVFKGFSEKERNRIERDLRKILDNISNQRLMNS